MLSVQIFISIISGPEITFALAILLSIFLYKENDTKDFYTILFTSSLAMCVTYTLKYMLKIPRPTDMLVDVSDYRFPSGHATMSAVIMCLGIHYAHLHIKDKHVRYFLYISAVAWYILVSYSRLYLKVHLPIDVLIGGLIGTLSAFFVIKIFKHLHYYKK